MYFNSCQTKKKEEEKKTKKKGEKMPLLLSHKNKTLKSKVEFQLNKKGHSNQSRKINKSNPNWKRRSKTLTVYR